MEIAHNPAAPRSRISPRAPPASSRPHVFRAKQRLCFLGFQAPLSKAVNRTQHDAGSLVRAKLLEMIASCVRGGVARAVATGGRSVARRPSVVTSAWRGACPSVVVSARGFASKKPEDHPYLTNHANARYLPGFSFPAPRKLKDIVKLQLLERESTHHIRDIWLDHHSERGDCVAGALTVPEYKELEDRGRKWCVAAQKPALVTAVAVVVHLACYIAGLVCVADTGPASCTRCSRTTAPSLCF